MIKYLVLISVVLFSQIKGEVIIHTETHKNGGIKLISYHKMVDGGIKIEHILMFVIVAFLLYYLSRCSCNDGFSVGGQITSCTPNPCKNSEGMKTGQCTRINDELQCLCNDHYIGSRCQFDKDNLPPTIPLEGNDYRPTKFEYRANDGVWPDHTELPLGLYCKGGSYDPFDPAPLNVVCDNSTKNVYSKKDLTHIIQNYRCIADFQWWEDDKCVQGSPPPPPPPPPPRHKKCVGEGHGCSGGGPVFCCDPLQCKTEIAGSMSGICRKK